MLTDSFNNDLFFFLDKIRNKENFCITRYGDGEYFIMINKKLSTLDGWTFRPWLDKKIHRLLLESFHYVHPDYYVGIPCPCCQPPENIKWFKENVKTQNLTWANIFVNGNYPLFEEQIIPLFKSRKVHLVANKKGQVNNLPFEVENFYPVGKRALRFNLNLIPQLEESVADAENELFLFCAGPLGKVLAQRLHMKNPNNTYLDLGSSLNKFLYPNKPNRDYLMEGGYYHGRICVW